MVHAWTIQRAVPVLVGFWIPGVYDSPHDHHAKVPQHALRPTHLPPYSLPTCSGPQPAHHGAVCIPYCTDEPWPQQARLSPPQHVWTTLPPAHLECPQRARSSPTTMFPAPPTHTQCALTPQTRHAACASMSTSTSTGPPMMLQNDAPCDRPHPDMRLAPPHVWPPF